ncbi:bacterioferritin [Candidatus Bipolaricaulota bacterium]|nr:bacterioferritin [Candidatus Bipolaricaulota bacterium]
MKGNERLLEELNRRLREELSAINQYFVHAEECEDWGYVRLAKAIKARAITEMRHAEALIERILFLEGKPIVSELGPIRIGEDVKAIHEADLESEYAADRAYNETIKLAQEVGDNATKVLLEGILKDEEEHVDWIEAQLEQIKQMGLENYLTEQLEED